MDWKFQWAEVLDSFWDSHQCQHSIGGLKGQQWFARATKWNISGTKNVLWIITYTHKTPARLCEWTVKLSCYKTALPFHMLRCEIQTKCFCTANCKKGCTKMLWNKEQIWSLNFCLFAVSHLLCTLTLCTEPGWNHRFSNLPSSLQTHRAVSMLVWPNLGCQKGCRS